MTFALMVNVTDTERKRVLLDILNYTDAKETKKLMLQMARELKYRLSEEETTRFIADLTKAFAAKPDAKYKVPAKPLADEDW